MPGLMVAFFDRDQAKYFVSPFRVTLSVETKNVGQCQRGCRISCRRLGLPFLRISENRGRRNTGLRYKRYLSLIATMPIKPIASNIIVTGSIIGHLPLG